MKIYSIALSILFVGSCFAQEAETPKKVTIKDFYQHAQFWVSKCFVPLKFEDRCLLINAFYLNRELFEQEIKVANSIFFAELQSGMINDLMRVDEEEAKKIALASAVALRKLKEEYLPARSKAKLSMHACEKELHQPTHSELAAIMEGYRNYEHAILAQFAKQDSPTISKVIQDCQTSYSKNLEALLSYNTTLKAIVDRKNPYAKDENEIESSNFNVALSVTESSLINLRDMVNNTIRVRLMALDMYNISKLMTEVFYQTMYEQLEKEDQLPAFIMFNEHGPIASEERWQDLPTPVSMVKKNK